FRGELERLEPGDLSRLEGRAPREDDEARSQERDLGQGEAQVAEMPDTHEPPVGQPALAPEGGVREHGGDDEVREHLADPGVLQPDRGAGPRVRARVERWREPEREARGAFWKDRVGHRPCAREEDGTDGDRGEDANEWTAVRERSSHDRPTHLAQTLTSANSKRNRSFVVTETRAPSLSLV